MSAPRKAAPVGTVKRPIAPVVMDLADFDESINACIYGDPGSGKTPLAATLPNVLILATEPGTISAVRYGNAKGKVIRALNFREFRRAYLWLRDVEVPAKTYDWLVVDSVTRMQEMLLRNILDEMHASSPHRDPDIPDKGEHQKWQVQFKNYVNMINDLPINVLWTAQAMHSIDFEENRTVSPMLQGKNGTDDSKTMSMWFSSTVSLLGYLGVDEEGVSKAPNRRLAIRRSGDYSDYVVKDRFDLGVPYIDNPNLSEVYGRIKNGADPAATQPRARASQRG